MKAAKRSHPCILGMDPGTNNLAYAVLRLDPHNATLDTSVYVETGMINATMRTLTIPAKLKEERLAFVAEVNGILERHNIEAIVLERYMMRIGMGGTAIEAINQMIGLLQTYDLPLKMIPSSQWKNDVTKGGEGLDLACLYIDAKQCDNRSEHEVDAACITMYGASRLLKEEPEYDRVVQEICSIPQSSLGVSTQPKRKPKRKRKRRASG